ncbi:type II toxin-antitoxin system Phd/YefM family antitoxin [Endozoicomonas numazuensis]|uniref:Antitoxin n=1 Tax=Endozoicomonas numazuensis TaxID=1137799 RepID=A0A081NJA2_9GAMM|nr:type II toxin-antitoxin system Phd/YefM family antitoxin [Endozoicomonas numazuensis]KEQ18525.1 hypothetical protein GZ78_13700 [Endozoicomonas numazuensis]
MKTITVSGLKANAANLDAEGGLIITQNGAPKYVVETYEDYEKREQAIALLKLMTMAESDIQQSRTLTSEELKSQLLKKQSDTFEE